MDCYALFYTFKLRADWIKLPAVPLILSVTTPGQTSRSVISPLDPFNLIR